MTRAASTGSSSAIELKRKEALHFSGGEPHSHAPRRHATLLSIRSSRIVKSCILRSLLARHEMPVYCLDPSPNAATATRRIITDTSLALTPCLDYQGSRCCYFSSLLPLPRPRRTSTTETQTGLNDEIANEALTHTTTSNQAECCKLADQQYPSRSRRRG